MIKLLLPLSQARLEANARIEKELASLVAVEGPLGQEGLATVKAKLKAKLRALISKIKTAEMKLKFLVGANERHLVVLVQTATFPSASTQPSSPRLGQAKTQPTYVKLTLRSLDGHAEPHLSHQTSVSSVGNWDEEKTFTLRGDFMNGPSPTRGHLSKLRQGRAL